MACGQLLENPFLLKIQSEYVLIHNFNSNDASARNFLITRQIIALPLHFIILEFNLKMQNLFIQEK